MDNNQLTDMIQVYFECNKNRGAAVRLYRERFPDREVPEPRKFTRLEENLRNYGAFKKPKKEKRQFNENTEFNALLTVEETPRTSIREISNNIRPSKRTTQSFTLKLFGQTNVHLVLMVCLIETSTDIGAKKIQE
ncbi:hypothetical protein ABEB36_009321 [Hypothenemus hampei]|uniref:DUF4817 domain-containing protein n=1 Tax=Hypothenemus hampei TaxID=57062 RepID=A0ABD1EGH0_HYPHA